MLDTDPAPEDIIGLARLKLLRSNDINKHLLSLTPRQQAAVIDVRVMLDYEPDRQLARDLQSQLVGSHMRIAYSVPRERACLRSGYSSEPILVEAAAQQMYAVPTDVERDAEPTPASVGRSAVVDSIKGLRTGGYLNKGGQGEFVARLLLTFAYDAAIEREQAEHRDYSQGVSVISFIEALFPHDDAQKILHSVPNNNVADATQFRDAFKDAVVRFTHFGEMSDKAGTSAMSAYGAFLRGMAIVCRNCQRSVDIVIPVMLDRSKKLYESGITGILVKVKNRDEASSIAECQFAQEILPFYPPGSRFRPWICLVMELGVQMPLSPEAMAMAGADTHQNKRQKTSQHA